MNENQISLRAKANLPTVLLTLLSIVQALALELIWGYLSDDPLLFTMTLTALFGWLQVSATLLGIILIWLIYSGLVMRFSWVPSTTDAIFPFVVGILEFAQIGSLGTSEVGAWFFLTGVLFAVVAFVSQDAMKRARQDSDNDDFFLAVAPATLRDHISAIVPSVSLMLVGMGFWVTAARGLPALVAVAVLIVLLLWQLWMNHVYTERSYRRRHAKTL